MLLRRLSVVLAFGLIAVVLSEKTDGQGNKLNDDDDETAFEEVEIVTASSTAVDDDEPTGPFKPPDEQDMLKFEAKDAITERPLDSEKDVPDTGTDWE